MQSATDRTHRQVQDFGDGIVAASFDFPQHEDLAVLVAELVEGLPDLGERRLWAIALPVALVIAPYLGVAGEVILFSALVTAGMPFLLLVGAAPNAIAYDSGQFTTAEFFLYGIPASVLLMIVTGFAVYVLWPLQGMPVLTGG